VPKFEAKKRARSRSSKGGLPWFAWLAIALGIVAIIAFVRTFPISGPAGSSQSGESKAAIIDQLYSLQPNEDFISEVTQQLEAYGFAVDIYQGDDVSVDLYRQLPSYAYDLIIFRAHSGLLGSNGKIIRRTCVFTNEPYSQTRHVAEQLGDQLAKARIDENHPWVFAIGDKFVTQSMEGQFGNTVVVMMGCSCLYLDDLAQAFIDKGASAYIAWDATVELDYVDKATVSLIKNLCSRNFTLEKAVDLTMATEGSDPKYHAVLKYYPPKGGNKTLKQLINT